MSLEVRRLGPSLREDFFRLHSPENSAGQCFCVAWWVPSWEGWAERTAEENRALREGLLRGGEYDGYLLYREGDPIGWCQAGARDRLQKLVRRFRLEPEPETWALSCFLIAPTHRRRGYATFFLSQILEDLIRRGVRRVEAFPKRGPSLEAEDLWTGPESLFLAAGFRILRDDPRRPILVWEHKAEG